MSKSGGTFVTVQTLREKGYDPLAYRYLCLTAHYRTQLEFSYESLDSAAKSLKNLRQLAWQAKTQTTGLPLASEAVQDWQEKFVAAMEDDLNAPRALALTWEALRSSLQPAEKLAFVQFADGLLSLDLLQEPKEEKVELPSQVAALLEQRAQARQNKDWQKSDQLRDQIAALGYVVKDTPQGQQTEKK